MCPQAPESMAQLLVPTVHIPPRDSSFDFAPEQASVALQASSVRLDFGIPGRADAS